VIGPSIKEIAKIYKDKNGNMVGFLKGEVEAIVDPSQFAVMQANLEITKTFTEEELKAVEAYIYSNLK
jgi:cytochrome c